VPRSPESLIVIGASSFLFLVGLFDDILNIKPYQKLFGQLIGATMIVGLGPKLPLTGYELVDIWITVFWLIGITNAINLLDNMDGLAAGSQRSRRHRWHSVSHSMASPVSCS
jgi:UDP-GlcNAc:undecaprenyl-phosphate GlcNAc-1-phosphate transferase